jgi:hypothetical protein
MEAADKEGLKQRVIFDKLYNEWMTSTRLKDSALYQKIQTLMRETSIKDLEGEKIGDSVIKGDAEDQERFKIEWVLMKAKVTDGQFIAQLDSIRRDIRRHKIRFMRTASMQDSRLKDGPSQDLDDSEDDDDDDAGASGRVHFAKTPDVKLYHPVGPSRQVPNPDNGHSSQEPDDSLDRYNNPEDPNAEDADDNFF